MILFRRIVGESMEPTLVEGDVVVALKKTPKQGDIVIARVNGREVIKRITRYSPTHLHLQGDNTDFSTDSRNYGDVPHSSLLGVVIKTFKK